jgi:hypothetical protein
LRLIRIDAEAADYYVGREWDPAVSTWSHDTWRWQRSLVQGVTDSFEEAQARIQASETILMRHDKHIAEMRAMLTRAERERDTAVRAALNSAVWEREAAA